MSTQAIANAALGTAAIYPSSVTAGQTGVAVSLDIENTSTPDTLTVTLNTIAHLPSCGGYTIITCSSPDTGVFVVSPLTGTGQAGTACAGVNFTFTLQGDGSYNITWPGTITLAAPNVGNNTRKCVIDFTVNVAKAPTVDASGNAGLQTRPSGTTTGTASDTTEAVGFGTTLVTVDKANPGITTSATAGPLPAGSSISDTATVTGGLNPTGTVTFNLYGPSDPTCAGPAVFTSANRPLSGGPPPTATSASFTANVVGTYHWIATYNGDSNNNAVSGLCTDSGEASVITQQTPGISTTAQPGATTTLGTALSDNVTVTGTAGTPTGTVTFNLYGPNDASCSGAAIFTATVALSGGTANSGNFTPTALGVYRWTASYSGDSTYTAVSHPCNSANESTTVNQATPGISTTRSPGASATIGSSLSDTATVTGNATGGAPTGTVTFNLYGPNDASCTGAVIFTSTNALSPATATTSTATSGSFTPVALGTYRWTASYSGDANYVAVSHPCNSANESTTITQATPSISTVAQPSTGNVAFGTALSDTVTVSGSAGTPTGNVTFRLYGPNDATCSGAAVFTSTVALSGGSATSGTFTPASAGVYRWTATYAGDTNYSSVTHPCNSANESTTIDKATPTIVTVAQPGATTTLGTALSDTVTVSGSAGTPTGTVTFNLYGPNDASCSGAVIFTATIALSGGTANSGNFTPTALGVYRWTATYNGNTNYNTVSHPCNSTNETTTVDQATPTIVTVAQPGASTTLGTALSDNVTVSGNATGGTPTGTVTFNLYGPNDASCSGAAIFTATVALSGGTANSGNFTPSSPGVYRWTATYNGNTNYVSVSHPCNSTNESTTVNKANPTIVTVAQPGASAALGVALSDTATVTGNATGGTPTGNVTFNLYGPNDASCSGAVVFTSTVALSGGSATSGTFTPTTAGVYRWTATYAGDANYNSVSHPCNSTNESTTVNKDNPTIVTNAQPGASTTLGNALSDTATVTGSAAGGTPTGTVTFNLYGPNDASCSGAVIFTATVALSGGTANSGNFTPTAPGVYRWTATYNGNTNYNTVSHPCNSTNESTTVDKATPTIVTVAQPGASTTLGNALSDTATVSGNATGGTPTGTVTFNLYGPNDASCSGAVIFTATVALSGGTANSGNFTPTAPGVYRWTATYNGNTNYNTVSHPCNSTNESTTVNKATPTIVTVAQPGATAGLGIGLSDTATVTGNATGGTPTGTVTFNLYGPNDASCSGAVAFTATIALSGGTANSGSFTPAAVGVYRWTATYNGDANYNSVSHPCNSANESTTVGKVDPTIVTTASPSVASPIGTSLSDSATVSGSGATPTGTVTFNLYGPNDASCSGAAIFTATIALSGGVANSGTFASTAAGVYRWTATYNGDSNYNSISHPCNSANESSTINKSSPTISTTASAGGVLGPTQISDTATVSGGTNPTGTVTFNLYGPNDASCSGAVIFTATVALSAGSANSGNFTPTAPGVYRWTATYNGDANNNSVSHPCNSANESATITPANPTLVTQTTPNVFLGTPITDTATLSGGVNPTGSITFNLYGPNDATCANPPVFTSNAVTVNGNGAYVSTPSYTPLVEGTYRWIASYTGDGNNNAVSGACNDAGESVVVTRRPPDHPVPTLSQWALLLASLMLAGTAIATLRRQRRR